MPADRAPFDPAVRGDTLARSVLAFAAGLAGQLLYDPVDEAEVLALVRSTMAALTPGPPD
jgi:hypothetical protein